MQNFKTPLRYLFGALWVLFSLNFFFHFLPQPPPSPEAGVFLGALYATGYFFQFVKIVELICGLALLANLFVPLSLVILAPITINIFLVHFFLDISGIPVAVIMVILHVMLGRSYMAQYRPMLKAKNP